MDAYSFQEFADAQTPKVVDTQHQVGLTRLQGFLAQ